MQEVLAAREARVHRQVWAQKTFGGTTLSFTLNIAGPVKSSPLILRAFREGVGALCGLFSQNEILYRGAWEEKTGPHLILSLNKAAEEVKGQCVALEEEHPLGRLFDADVISPSGEKLERGTPRCCLICENEAFSCASRRRHSVEELQEATQKILLSYFAKRDGERLAELCHEALLFELSSTPKAGLVDQINSGSHKDMDFAAFEKSADALYPLWADSFELGLAGKEEEAEALFLRLRRRGLEAEEAMLSATGGVNTHKGALFLFCLVCGACGRLWNGEGFPSVELLCEEVKKIAVHSLSDFEKKAPDFGLLGARGEAAQGFPTAQAVLPVLQELLKKEPALAGAVTLLHLIARGEDTNLFRRGGKEGALWAQRSAEELIRGRIPTREELEALDEAFIGRNLSPGGSADLLALSYLMHSIQKEERI